MECWGSYSSLPQSLLAARLARDSHLCYVLVVTAKHSRPSQPYLATALADDPPRPVRFVRVQVFHFRHVHQFDLHARNRTSHVAHTVHIRQVPHRRPPRAFRLAVTLNDGRANQNPEKTHHLGGQRRAPADHQPHLVQSEGSFYLVEEQTVPQARFEFPGLFQVSQFAAPSEARRIFKEKRSKRVKRAKRIELGGLAQ